MNNNLFSVKNFEAKSSHIFFFDNNIWMILYCPVGNYQKEKQQRLYSVFLQEILSVNAGLVINSLVISEFCNASLRLDFNLWKREIGNSAADFKRDFVPTNRFRETADSIKSAIRGILKYCSRINDEFNSIDVESILNIFGVSDFNDSYYLELARQKGYKIVTEDTDFFGKNSMGVEIITSRV